jgi:hypothetical protein
MKIKFNLTEKEKESLIPFKLERVINGKIVNGIVGYIPNGNESSAMLDMFYNDFYNIDKDGGEMIIYLGNEYMVFSKDGKDVKRGYVSSIFTQSYTSN